MSDKKFIDGLIVKAPNDGAPDYVKAKLSIKREELIAWLGKQTGDWINADIKESQQGKWYCSVDDWKPKQGGQRNAPPRGEAPGDPDPYNTADDYAEDDIPF